MTDFYGRNLYRHIALAKPIKQSKFDWAPHQEWLDRIILGDSRNLAVIPDNSVALIITSPPYCVGMDYDQDSTIQEYLTLLQEVYRECFRILEIGGRLCVNTANVGRKPYIPYTSLTWALLAEIGFLPRGEIIWNKGQAQTNNTAWGSFRQASNPTLRDQHEYILVASKGQYGRSYSGTSTISSKEYTTWTRTLWDIKPESAKRIGHPAPFPVELPRRLIKLYSYESDVVLDPFSGAGSTAVAAIGTGRHFMGVDNVEAYVELSRSRIAKLYGIDS